MSCRVSSVPAGAVPSPGLPVHEQPQLIDQTAAQEGLHERDAAHDRAVPPFACLSLVSSSAIGSSMRAAFCRLTSGILRTMSEETLHLNAHETVRVVRQTPDELEVEATWTPAGPQPPPHLHPAQEEHFEVLAGQLAAVVDGVERVLGPGDSLEIPRGTPHTMWNQGSEQARVSWRTRPAGRTAEWFRTIDRLGHGGKRNPPLPAMAAALTRYGDVFQLAIGPRPLRPAVRAALRLLALAARRS